MGDAVLRVQKHLHELARDNFARLEKAHVSNVAWLEREFHALVKDINVAVKLELKRPVPVAFTTEYAFVPKKPRLETPPPPAAHAVAILKPVSPPAKSASVAAAAAHTTSPVPVKLVAKELPAPSVTASAPTVASSAPARLAASPQPVQPVVKEPPTLTVAPPAAPLVAPAAPVAAVTTVKVKRMVTRTRRVLRPKASARPTSRTHRRKKNTRVRLDPTRMKVVELRAELKKRGLKAAGLKAVLLDRLLDALADEPDTGYDSSSSSDDDGIVEMEEVEEEYETEIEVDEPVESTTAPVSGPAVERKPVASSVETLAKAQQVADAPVTAVSRKSDDEIVRESLDGLSLSQQSTDEMLTKSAQKQRHVAETLPDVYEADEEDTQSTQGDETMALDDGDTDALVTHTAGAEPTTQPPASRQPSPVSGASNLEMSLDASKDVASASSSTDTSASEPTMSAPPTVQTELLTEDTLEKKSSRKVSFAAAQAAVVPDSAPTAAVPVPETSQSDSVSRFRSRSLPQAPAITTAHPVTPNGQWTTGELAVARSEPMPVPTTAPDAAREHELTIEREAQRLRIAAKMSAKKRFEEAKLSSSFWAKRDRMKSNAATTTTPSASSSSSSSATAAAVASTPSTADVVAVQAPTTTVVIKAEPEPAALASEIHSLVPAPVPSALPSAKDAATAAASLTAQEKEQATTTSTAKTQAPVKVETKSVAIPFATSSRRFSDPSRRGSALRRRESTSSRRDSADSTRRESVASRRTSLRRRDSGSSTVSSVSSTKSTSGNSKATAAASTASSSSLRKPSNLVSSLHSFTSLIETETTTAAAAAPARSAPVVNALKLAEKTRLLEQKKHLEKTKRKEALMKKYEEQRKLDDERKRKLAVGVKEKSEREAKLKREQDKLNEKKLREAELAKRRQQKLQEMRAGLEKKRALLAAEKQQQQAAAAAKLAAAAAAAAQSVSATSTRLGAMSSSSSSASQSVKATAPLSTKPSATAANVQVSAASAAAVKPVKSTNATPAVAKSSYAATGPPPPPSKPTKPVKPSKTDAATVAKPKDRPTDTSTYDMSDNAESSGSESDDDDDGGKHNKKNIPRWARKENLERILRVQFGPNASDPSPSIFPDFVDTCDLDAIFEPTDVRKKRRFAKRSSSGNWFGDRPTAREKALYKRDMGYLR